MYLHNTRYVIGLSQKYKITWVQLTFEEKEKKSDEKFTFQVDRYTKLIIS